VAALAALICEAMGGVWELTATVISSRYFAFELHQREFRRADHCRGVGGVDLRLDGRRLNTLRYGHGQAVFGGRRRAGAVETADQIVAEIMADAVLDRRDLDRLQVSDQAGMRGLAVERLEAPAKRQRQGQRGEAARSIRPPH